MNDLSAAVISGIFAIGGVVIGITSTHFLTFLQNKRDRAAYLISQLKKLSEHLEDLTYNEINLFAVHLKALIMRKIDYDDARLDVLLPNIKIGVICKISSTIQFYFRNTELNIKFNKIKTSIDELKKLNQKTINVIMENKNKKLSDVIQAELDNAIMPLIGDIEKDLDDLYGYIYNMCEALMRQKYAGFCESIIETIKESCIVRYVKRWLFVLLPCFFVCMITTVP